MRRVGREHGLDAVGVTHAGRFDDVRRVLEERRAAGLHAGMAFTYRNPARSTDPARALTGARSLVVGARRYVRAEPPVAPTRRGARIARYSWVDHYAPLRAALGQVAEHLRGAGWRATVLVDDNALVDRAAAHRAGLGWWGKNTTLLLPAAGSWYVLGTVVSDAPLVEAGAGPPTVPDGCGPCTRCAAACPTGALDTPGVLDARRCLAWLVQAPGSFPREHRVALGDRLYGCDDCQEACPVNRLDARRRPPPPAEAGAEAAVDAVEILAAADEELLGRFGRWWIAGRDPAHLRRNALLVLANTASPDDPATRRAVAAAARHPSSEVRAHAVWAAKRLGHEDVVVALSGDADPMVAEEVAHALAGAVPRRAAPDPTGS